MPYLLFAHAFPGCDATLAIYQFVTTSIFKKLKNSQRLRKIADIYKVGQNPQTIGNAAISFFEALYLPSLSLPEIRKKTYVGVISNELLLSKYFIQPRFHLKAYFF